MINRDNTVIFDMDGVIFDSEKYVFQCWNTVAKKYQIEGINDVLFQCIGRNSNDTKRMFLEKYGKDFPYDKYREESSALFQKNAKENGLPVKKGAKNLLLFLKEHNVKTGLASSTRKCMVEQELTVAGLISYFDVVIGGDMVEKSKPQPDIFLMCAKKLDVVPKDIYVIEDSFNGVKAAYRAGMKPIMVPDLVMPDDEMKKIAFRIFEDLTKVQDYFETI